MKIKNKTHFIISTGLILLTSGCTIFDVLKNENLPENLRQTVIEMRLRASSQCTTHTYEQTSGRKLTGDVKMATEVTIRRLFISETDWFKAEMQGNGVIDNVFYSPKNGRFICGQKTWDKYSDTKGVEFKEYGTSEKTLGITNKNTPSNNISNTKPTDDKRSIAISWDGYQNLISGSIELAPNPKTVGLVSIKLPNNEGSCSGQTKQIDRKTGVWSISCTNGMSAAGTYDAYGDGQGASGTGTDSKGNKVRYTISARN